MKTFFPVLAASAPLLFGALTPSRDLNAAPRYAVTDLGEGFWPLAINNVGQIVGERVDRTTGIMSAWLLDHGELTPIDHAGMIEVSAESINNQGLVVGWASGEDRNSRGFTWDAARGWQFLEGPAPEDPTSVRDVNDNGDVVGFFGVGGVRNAAGVVTPLGALGGGGADGLAVNARGDVVGFSAFEDGTAHAFFWRDGEMQDLNVAAHVPGGVTDFECAYDVNAAGLAVGIAAIYSPDGIAPSQQFGFLAVPATEETEPSVTIFPEVGLLGVNDSGWAAGWMYVGEGIDGGKLSAAVIYEGGALHNVNDLLVGGAGIYVTYASDVNARGQILAVGDVGSEPGFGPFHGFLLTPAPEPGAAALALAAITALAPRCGRARRRSSDFASGENIPEGWPRLAGG